jgi:PadR family transcriptional regulator AphA
MIRSVSNGDLTPTSYVVLGLVTLLGQATSYDMKRLVGLSIGHFWAFPHSQLYAEPDRLVRLGLLEETREHGGRRRRIYSVTAEGRDALSDWLADPSGDPPELRDPGALKLFFGNFGSREDVVRLAKSQVQMYEEEGEQYRALAKQFEGVTGIETQLSTLRLGTMVNEACLAFWREIAENPPVPTA